MRVMVKFSVLLLLFISNAVFASQGPASNIQKAYYGEKFYDQVLGKEHDNDLKDALKKILKSGHIAVDGGFDQIVDRCGSLKNCVTHTAYGYDRARVFLFGKFYLVKLDASNYGIKEMYCDRIYQKEDFKSGSQPGPGIVPSSTIINVEHTWPQSKFSGRYSKELQKSDMHHLFPTDSVMNALRGNNIFGEVQQDQGSTKCSASRFGVGSAGPATIYEPPADHKGHVARSLFYFSIRYDLPIRPEEEVVLKKWNHEHPVDAEELARNDEIAKLQGDRNPFIDHAELADDIADF